MYHTWDTDTDKMITDLQVLQGKYRPVHIWGTNTEQIITELSFTQKIQTCTIPGVQTQNRLLLTMSYKGNTDPYQTWSTDTEQKHIVLGNTE